jgi:predicted DNA-binding protein with PD1-like motif
MLESKRQRTFVVRVERDESIVESLLELASSQEVVVGRVSGSGVLRAATLDLPKSGGGRTDAYVLEGPFELLALSGKVTLGDDGPTAELGVQLARATDVGLTCVGGRVLDAIAEDVELVVVALDETMQRRDREREPVPESAPAAAGWAAVAAASEAAEEASVSPRRGGPTKGGGLVPARGEFIDHKVFGVCRVEAVKPDGTMIIKLETGRRKQLKLDALEILEPKTGGSRVIYPVQMRRPA